ncbi:PepSY domain-containing protein [Psychroserpens algicola]|uniref:PepSY domain-containing protein n=1 Tax=Psychroserpens algicola TaxID=1719034 RepID=A0ABT0HBC5_9FLAO|nr:PepSY domain-containing protein [Psychroserpens algicola]MCK8481653.1 PepSY domain-containing protein [Psychroserpens algicola]
MTMSIWRFSHFLLALISSVFIVLASVTGMILAFEPISNQLQSYGFNDEVTIATTIENLQGRYDEIITIETDENDFVVASVITKAGESETFYINPETGEKLGDLIEKAPLFSFATNLHRSLFLKSTGRFIVGLVSFFLVLMAISGIMLILKRQGGIRRYFSKVVNENFEQYYHVVFGRWFLIPILIVALTGVYLSLEKFSMLPETHLSHEYPETEDLAPDTISISDFEVFKTLKLADVNSLEFPFSEAVDDYFFIKLKNRELLVNQYSGAILSEQDYPLVTLLSQWSLFLHTGQGTILWSVVLFLVCVALLFFIYSGFAMTLNRRKKTKVSRNKFTKDTSEYIILVGSETGSTFSFASMFYEALIAQGKTVFMASMNTYTCYKEARHLFIFTSTYGEGDAPSNASKFEDLVKRTAQNHTIDYAVLGFGSLQYPDYCKYAEDVDMLLTSHQNFQQKLEVFKINNQSFDAFQNWIQQWEKAYGLTLQIKPPKVISDSKYTRQFRVVERTELNNDATFMLRLQPIKKVAFQSGDLLAFRPDDSQAERLYSIARIGDEVLLSIKKHEQGLCSFYLSQRDTGDVITATVQPNPEFHLSKSSNTILIANGTGIAPFLGMIHDSKTKKNRHLFLGLRTQQSLQLYSRYIDQALTNHHLKTSQVAFSQDTSAKVYVQDLIKQHDEFIANHLKNGGIVMICGSIVMQNQVFEVLDAILQARLNLSIQYFQSRSQIKTDCY